jgi:RNA polymerase sigma-70 factor (ECF subfamily)
MARLVWVCTVVDNPLLPGRAGVDADAALVSRVQAGDLRAYDVLAIKYQRRLERLIGRFVHDAHTVQDLTQETFIRAYRALPQFRGDAQFYTWLYRIAGNTAKRHLAEQRHDPGAHAFSLDAEAGEDETFLPPMEPSTDESPESLLAAKEVAQAISAAVERLPADLREALVLREIEGLSYDEIAQQMQTPPGTVRSRIFRAREAVSAQVKPLLERQTGKRW